MIIVYPPIVVRNPDRTLLKMIPTLICNSEMEAESALGNPNDWAIYRQVGKVWIVYRPEGE